MYIIKEHNTSKWYSKWYCRAYLWVC